MFKGNTTGKYLVLLTCVLLFIAAVDTIPDPPAINPPGSAAHRISALYLHGAATSTDRADPVILLAPSAPQMDRSGLVQSSDEEVAGIFSLGFVRHAADSSPPSSF